MNSDYRQELIITINNLIEARHSVFDRIVFMGTEGEFKEIVGSLSVGEKYSFTLKHFSGMRDVNIQKLVEICGKMEETVFTLMDLNGISDEEVEW